MQTEAKKIMRRRVLSRNLHSLMTIKNINQSDLSRQTGVAQPSISRMLSEVSSPRITSVQEIAEYFGVGMDYLLTKNNLFNDELES
jgi:transcriptional regulator with XRE-family HTH domain